MTDAMKLADEIASLNPDEYYLEVDKNERDMIVSALRAQARCPEGSARDKYIAERAIYSLRSFDQSLADHILAAAPKSGEG